MDLKALPVDPFFLSDLKSLPVHWYHLFVSIKYHISDRFAICNIIRIRRTKMVQNIEIKNLSGKNIDSGGSYVIY